MMTVVTIANFLTASQGNLWTLIRNDVTVSAITKNVLDGIPVGLTAGTGFPYVIVPTPEVTNGERVTLNSKREHVTFKVSVFDRKESVLRTLCDAIRNAVETNKNVFAGYGMYQYMNTSTSLSYVIQEDNAVVYNYVLSFEYEWWDC